MPRLLALLFLTASVAVAQTDTLAVASDTTRSDSLVRPVAAGPLAPVRAALADSVAERTAFPPMPAALAGVVWDVPDSTEAAVADLVAMHGAGVRQVRTGLVEDTLVLRAASDLGMALFQDLPVRGQPAMFLVRDTERVAGILREALDRARPYAAARHFGLAQGSDTSDPRVRPYFQTLTDLVRQRGADGTRTYYVTRFVDDDRADETVDLVLLDARDRDPIDLLRRWRVRHETPIGIASLGVGVRPGRDGGWRTPGTPANQARTLESALGDLLLVDEAPAALFIHRWRDTPDESEARDDRTRVAGTQYGLMDEGNEVRPAYEVVRGFYTGRQRVFAFDAGTATPEARQASPLLLLGWVLVLGLGVFYAGAPKLSALAPRYFGRRDLYREAIQRGYDLSTAETGGLALGLSLVVGIVGTAVLRAFAKTDAIAAATASWTPEAQARLTELIGQPLALALLIALVYAAWLLLNLIWLNVLSGRRRLRPAQALSLAVWSRWGWLVLLAGAALLIGMPPQTATAFAPVILGLALLIEIVAGYRMLLDFGAVVRVSPVRSLLLGYGLPFLLVVAGLIALAVTGRDEAGFIWHLATRS